MASRRPSVSRASNSVLSRPVSQNHAALIFETRPLLRSSGDAPFCAPTSSVTPRALLWCWPASLLLFPLDRFLMCHVRRRGRPPGGPTPPPPASPPLRPDALRAPSPSELRPQLSGLLLPLTTPPLHLLNTSKPPSCSPRTKHGRAAPRSRRQVLALEWLSVGQESKETTQNPTRKVLRRDERKAGGRDLTGP